MTKEEILEAGAALEHDRWARWYKWQRDNSTPENIERWNRQSITPYLELTEAEKESDRKETRNYLDLFSSYGSEQRKLGGDEKIAEAREMIAKIPPYNSGIPKHPLRMLEDCLDVLDSLKSPSPTATEEPKT